MTLNAEKGKAERRFHRHAESYDQYALIQRIVAEKLARLVKAGCLRPPVSVLDVGCGTGIMLSEIHKHHPETKLHGLDPAPGMLLRCAERLDSSPALVRGFAESLPYENRIFDLVVSSSTFQWIRDLDVCLKECLRVLKPDGMLCAAFFGGKTLWELQESYRHAIKVCFGADCDRVGRLQSFRKEKEAEDLLYQVGFRRTRVVMEHEIEYHPDVSALLRSIRNIGATTPAYGSASGGLGWRKVLNAMSERYQASFQTNALIPATYDVIYMIGYPQ